MTRNTPLAGKRTTVRVLGREYDVTALNSPQPYGDAPNVGDFDLRAPDPDYDANFYPPADGATLANLYPENLKNGTWIMDSNSWLKCDDPTRMVDYVCGEGSQYLKQFNGGYIRPSERQMRLIACAMTRKCLVNEPQENWLDIVQRAERYAEDSSRENKQAMNVLRPYMSGITTFSDRGILKAKISDTALATCQIEASKAFSGVMGYHRRYRHIVWGSDLADCVREVLGNPFEPVRATRGLPKGAQLHQIGNHLFPVNWVTHADNTVWNMALSAYTHQDFSMLPVLADALEDAGCSEYSMLDHLRSGKSHVRGCWVLSMLLDKE